MDEQIPKTMMVESGNHCQAKDSPEDAELIGAYLWYDGGLAAASRTKFVPISDPFYTTGRPEREAVPGGTCFCISKGGIPILCDQLFDFLGGLGAKGETANLIYRGSNKRAYDTVQQGFRRFLPSPVYKGEGSLKLTAELSLPLPAVFGIHATSQVKAPEPGTKTQYHIGLSLDSLQCLKKSMPRILLVPLYLKRGTEAAAPTPAT